MEQLDGQQEQVYFIYNTAILILYSVPAIFIFLKTKAKLEKSVVINIILFIISFSLKFLTWLLNYLLVKNDTKLQGIQLVTFSASFLIELSLYHFIFEMMGVYVALQSATHEEYLRGNIMTKSWRKLAICIQIFVFLVSSMFQIRFLFFDAMKESLIDNPVGYMDQLFKILRMIVDINMCYLFCKLALFFMSRKKEILAKAGRKFSLFNYFIVAYVLLLIIVNIYAFTMKTFMYQIQRQIVTGDSIGIFSTFDVYQALIFSTVDFFTAFGILYVFYLQSVKNQNKETSDQGLDQTPDEFQRPNYKTKDVQNLLYAQSTSINIDDSDNRGKSSSNGSNQSKLSQFAKSQGSSYQNSQRQKGVSQYTNKMSSPDSESSQFQQFLMNQMMDDSKGNFNYQRFKESIFDI
ncbi:UNKNOWN [Stylonychia lemnae]|uniref:Transmembrane protein n=1 Tax=Stylonychia lemnae TaxID=5949 RepID=A0A077ZZN7_STYLE|nr:UNKNOWN [Stylonychia lemnae]|eukprot:CDW75077.1 UNKNOWN [Stylonychia lemnae]